MRAVIGLGANLGDRLETLRAAARQLAALGQVLGRSAVYETAPVGGPPQPDYLNAAVLLDTVLEPAALMNELLGIESALGRVRKDRNEPRVIDLDILWIDGVAIATEALTIPHPRLVERAFALGPLLDVASDARDPSSKRAYAEARLDRSTLRRFDAL